MSASSGRHLVRGNQVHRPGPGDTGDAATIPDTAHAQNHQDVTPRSPRMCARHQRAVLQVCRHLVCGNQGYQPIHATSLFLVTHTVTIGWPRETGEHRTPRRKRRHRTPARQPPPRACHSGQRLERCLSVPSACNQPSESAGRETREHCWGFNHRRPAKDCNHVHAVLEASMRQKAHALQLE